GSAFQGSAGGRQREGDGGGGGGGGWFGGAGGGGANSDAFGGGGGSGYASPTLLESRLETGNQTTPANLDALDRMGAGSSGAAGGVVLRCR
ncbi:MAG: PE family protein, partial [Myxococcota bacterium]